MGELPHRRFAATPLFVIAGGLAAGILANPYFSTGSVKTLSIIALLTVATAFVSAWFASRDHPGAATILIIVTFVLAGIGLRAFENLPKAQNRIAHLYDTAVMAPGEAVEITGVVQGQPEHAPESFYLTLRTERLALKRIEQNVCGTILLRANARDEQVQQEYGALELRHGARVRVMTALEREENFRNPGVLPFTEYLERKGYDATGVIKSPLLIERLDDDRIFLPLAWLYQWRERLEREFSAKFSPETAGILDAALLGNRYNLSLASADRFRAGGTFHLLVISGLHISFIGGLVFVLVRWFTKRPLLQFFTSTTFLWAYTIAVGAQAPVARAALMFTLVVFAPIVWRRANSLNVIGGAALALLVWRPNDLFDPSSQLTFVSVLSIVLIAVPLLGRMERVGSWRPAMATPHPPVCSGWFRVLSESLFWSEREWRQDIQQSNITYRLFKSPVAAKLEKWHLQRLLRLAFAAILVSASVQLGMLPLLIIYFHRLSFASLVLNIFLGVLMAALAFVALIAIAISHFSVWLAAPFIVLAEKVSWLTIHFVDPFTRLGIASIRLPHYSGWATSIYLVYYVPLIFLIFMLARWNPLRPVSMSRTESKLLSLRNVRFAATAFGVLLMGIIAHPFSAAQPDGRLHVDFLDVGQGDSALLTMPDGTNLLVDGGGRPNFVRGDADDNDTDEPFERDTRSIGEGVVSEYLWSRGLDHVDYIVATHADADHIDGLNDVARNFKVRAAIVARSPSEDAEYVRFANTMKANGVPIEKVGAGDVLRFGTVSADVLWPPATADTNAPYDNNNGLVLRLHHGDEVLLFMADLERQAEAALLKPGSDLHANVIKVAHHGSKTSSTEAFVAAAHPSLAVISVGRTSIFGHPNKEVIERWRASGADVMTTGERGTISVVTDGRTLNVSTFVQH